MYFRSLKIHVTWVMYFFCNIATFISRMNHQNKAFYCLNTFIKDIPDHLFLRIKKMATVNNKIGPVFKVKVIIDKIFGELASWIFEMILGFIIVIFTYLCC